MTKDNVASIFSERKRTYIQEAHTTDEVES